MPDTHRAKFMLGRTRSQSPARRVAWYVSAEVRYGFHEGQWRTVTHGHITNPNFIAVQFAVGPRIQDHEWDHAVQIAGQVQPEDRRIVAEAHPDKYDTNERDGSEVRHIIDILAREWAGHTLNAGCAHQGMPTSRGPEGDPDLCPVTGYKYGSAWLVRPLDEAARERIALLKLDEIPVRAA